MVLMGNVQQSSQHPRHRSVITDEDKYNILLKSLLFDRIDFRVNNVKKALLSTCEWLFHQPDFKTWYEGCSVDEHSGFLWIKGKPGCGKSTLMKAALEWVRKRKNKKHIKKTVVPYFFNARASASLEKSALGLYRTLVHHLLSSCSFLANSFMDRFSFKDAGQSGENWTVEELQEFLYDTVESSEPFELCLFIDALDEAEYEDDVRHMIGFLVHLADRALAINSSCRLQVCLSSRHYPHISIGRGLSFVVEEQPEHGQDIEIYITKQLTCSDGLEKDELQVDILNKSARIFLWVVLVVNMLNKLDDHGAPLSDMKARLKTIPAGLNELFQEILMKSDHGIETSVLFFQWSVFSSRALEPAELFIAMEYSRSPSDLAWIPPPTIFPPSADRLAKYILNCSRGLVEVVQVASGQPAVVQFIHETVREFLLKDNGLASIVPALATNLVGISHEILRIACYRCISTNSIPQEYRHYCNNSHRTKSLLEVFRSDLRLKLPFLDYAISYLFSHAEQAEEHDISQQTFLKTQTNEDGVWLDPYRLWWNVLERYKTRKIRPARPLLFFLLERQFLALVRALLDSPGIGEKYETTLQLAADIRNLHLAQIMLDRGAAVCVHLKGPGSSILIQASQTGHLELVQTILNRDTCTDARGVHYTAALQEASREGHLEIVRLLLEKGADVSAKGGRYGDALQTASATGHLEVVRLLLEKGADVSAEGAYHGNALQEASRRGFFKVVQLLIENGADVNAQGGVFGNALQAASVTGHSGVVQMLIKERADVNAQGGRFGNALQVASYCSRTQAVHLLLANGADANAHGGRFGSALQAASDMGNAEIVRTLIENGADVNASGGEHGTALKAALKRGDEEIVEILREAGANE